MPSLTLLGSLLLALSSVGASTVVQTQTSIIPGSTSTPTPTPTPSYSTSSSSSCNFLGCGSSSCIPSTTELIEYVCDNTCLNSSTFTYTVTTYPPPITATLPCGGRFGKREPEPAPEPELEKRFTCVPGPTITSTTSMACSDCHQFPTLTTTTKSSLTTVYTSCGQYGSSSSSSATKSPSMTSVSPTKTSNSSTKTSSKSTSTYLNPTGGCWYICYNSAGAYTTLSYFASPTPTGYVRCLHVCA